MYDEVHEYKILLGLWKLTEQISVFSSGSAKSLVQLCKFKISIICLVVSLVQFARM